MNQNLPKPDQKRTPVEIDKELDGNKTDGNKTEPKIEDQKH